MSNENYEVRSEAQFQDCITRKWLVDDYHWSRIDQAASPGFPDLEYCTRGITGQLELKFSDGKRAPKLRASQKAWFRERLAVGGKPLIWLLCQDLIYVYTLKEIPELLVGESSVGVWKELAAGQIYVGNPMRDISLLDWLTLREVIR